ncbi:hypothetical protein M404DRAFT_1006781, partial [Pisolithus tinctorius Marx 270]
MLIFVVRGTFRHLCEYLRPAFSTVSLAFLDPDATIRQLQNGSFSVVVAAELVATFGFLVDGGTFGRFCGYLRIGHADSLCSFCKHPFFVNESLSRLLPRDHGLLCSQAAFGL